jgi:hypothetical protein
MVFQMPAAPDLYAAKLLQQLFLPFHYYTKPRIRKYPCCFVDRFELIANPSMWLNQAVFCENHKTAMPNFSLAPFVRGLDGMNCNRRSCINEYFKLRRNRENKILDANINLNILYAVLRKLSIVLIIYSSVIVHNIP